MTNNEIPSVKQLSSNPELAILDILERTLKLASSALIAIYEDPEAVSQEDSSEHAYAHAIVHHIIALELTVTRYRRALE